MYFEARNVVLLFLSQSITDAISVCKQITPPALKTLKDSFNSQKLFNLTDFNKNLQTIKTRHITNQRFKFPST